MRPTLTLIAVALLVCGCGPSAEERQARSDLSDVQKQYADSQAELAAAKARLAELEATKAELVDLQEKNRTEIDALRNRLTETQKDATSAQIRIKELEEELRKTLPPPQYEISGEIFIVTKGGSNYRLGLVDVAVLDKKKAEEFVEARSREQMKLLSVAKPKLEAAKKEREESEAAWKFWKNESSKHRFGTKEYERVNARESEALTNWGEKGTALIRAELEFRKLVSGSFFFDALPEAYRSVKTNSDGRFRISIPREMNVVVVAHATRHVGDSTEAYYWMVPVERPVQGDLELTMSNHNLSSVAGGSMFLSLEQ